MRRVKVKKIKVPSGTTDKGLADMFNQVINGDGITPTISYPRYERLRKLAEGVIKICNLVAQSPDYVGWPVDHPARAELAEFCTTSAQDLATYFSMDLSEHFDLSLLDDDIRARFADIYKKARESGVITGCVTTCDALISQKHNIMDMASLDGKFIVTMSGVDWSPVLFAPSMNFKDIFVTLDITPNTMRMMLMFLHKLYVFGMTIYNELQSPDIDVDKFVEFITQNIDILKKRDGLSRCNEAFDKIKESTKLLKSNFSSYYRQFVDTGDSTIIMQSFITDVSQSTKVRPEVLRQFRTIINYCTKVAAANSSDPQLKAACKKLSETMTSMDRKYHNIAADSAQAESESSSDDEDEPEETPEMAARRNAMGKSVDELAKEIGE